MNLRQPPIPHPLTLVLTTNATHVLNGFAFSVRYSFAGGSFLAYGWANGDESREYRVQQEQRQRELEQEPPPSGFKLQHTLRGHTEEIRQIAWSPDGRLLASGSNDQTVRLWDVTTGRQIRALEGHTDDISGISFSADSRILASKSGDGTVRLWKVDTWEE